MVEIHRESPSDRNLSFSIWRPIRMLIILSVNSPQTMFLKQEKKFRWENRSTIISSKVLNSQNSDLVMTSW